MWLLCGQATGILLSLPSAGSRHRLAPRHAALTMVDGSEALTLLGGALARTSQTESSREWQNVGGAWLRLPASTPWAVVHFVGGAALGSAPQLCYDALLSTVCDRGGVAVIASPYDTSPDHSRLATEVQDSFELSRKATEELGVAVPSQHVTFHTPGVTFLMPGVQRS